MPLMVLFILLLSFGVMGAATIVTPADNAELAIGSTYEFTGTSGLTGATYTCTYQYRLRGDDSWGTIATTEDNESAVNATVPNSFGTNQFRVGCTNHTTGVRYIEGANSTTATTTLSVSLRNYEAAEASEVTIDMIIAVGATIVGFATLIGLILLFGWVKKRF